MTSAACTQSWGERWQCLDCPERVGFDLCGACYDRRANVVGRFNQHHTSGAVRRSFLALRLCLCLCLCLCDLCLCC